MAVPQGRNQKKMGGRRNSPAKAYKPYRGTPLLRGEDAYGRPAIEEACDDELASLSTEERLLSIRQPGDGLEAMANRPELGERLLGNRRGMLLDSPNMANRDFADRADFSEVESDFEDLCDFD